MAMPKHRTTERSLLTKATEVLGSRETARKWLGTPSIALDYKCPAELLASPTGVEAVERLLGQMEHCVYV